MKKSFLCLFGLILFAGAAFAQVDVTATGGTANASYTTLKASFDAINLGTHQGTITIGISGNTTETAAAVLNASGAGSASYTTIAISPTGGAARTITGALATPLIDLNGADNVTIDGLNTGGNALTISNTSTSATAGTSTIRFINDATTNTIQNCTISGSSTLVTTGTIFFSTTTGAAGNDGNIINNNNIGPAGAALPFNAIFASGTTSTAAQNNSGVQITNNKIFDFFAPTAVDAGILLSSGNTDWTITGNSLYQTATRTMTTAATDVGIQINNTTGNNFVVSNNFIGGSAVSAGGTAWTIAGSIANRFRAISLNVGATTPSSVQGNTIANFAFTSNSSAATVGGPWTGIYLGAGNANIGTTTGNTIGGATGTGSVTISVLTNSGSVSSGIFCDASPTTTSISNNTIGAISFGASTISQGFQGIATTTASAGSMTISGNTIGSTTTANSINVNTGATSTTNQIVRGINNTISTVAVAITNNTIANVNNNYLPSSATSTSNILIGISSTAGINTITGNTIRNMTTSANHTGTNSTAPVIGILDSGSTAGQTIAQNTIHSLSENHATAAVNIYGIYWSNSSTSGNVIERNFVHSLATSSTGLAVINGIYNFNGSSTYRNNMIRLGIDAAGNSLTSGALTISGILADPVGTNNYYFNSVFVGGTGVTTGTAITSGFRRVTAADATDFRDNIVANNRSNSTGTGKHYAIALSSGSATFTSNYNVFNQTGTGAVFGVVTATDSATFANWKTNTSQDTNSFFSDPQFLTPAGTAATVNLHINPSTPTVVEGNGVLISPPTNDFDNETRASLTPVDIGADAGNFTSSGDAAPPLISYTPLSNGPTGADQTLTATITDAGSGVPTSGAGLPVLYYRVNAGAYTGVQGVSIGSNQYTFTFGSAATNPGDVVSYYVVAQDLAATPNVGAFPSGASGFTANPPAASVPPGTPSTYIAQGTLAGGSYNVGIGQTYATVTSAISALNNSSVTGAITLLLKDNTYPSESFPIVINPVAGASAMNTVTIKPDTGKTPVISGSSASSIFKINGADFVTIDGSNSGSADRSLTISNTNTASGTGALIVASLGTGAGATNDTIKNCIIKAGSIGTTANFTFGIFVGDTSGAAAGADNDNLTIQNNQIALARTGIQAVGTAGGVLDNMVISGNLIGDNTLANSLGRIGMTLQLLNNATISGNTIKNIFLSADTSSAIGLSLSTLTNSSVSQNLITGVQATGASGVTAFGVAASTASSGVTITQNTIDGISVTTTSDPVGMSFGSGFLTSTVSRNIITNVAYTGTGGYGGRGFDIATGSTTSALTFANNMISNIKGDGWSSFASDSIAGIRITGTTGGLNFYFNSVNLGSGTFAGNSSGTLSAAFYCAATVTALDLRDNIFATNLNNSAAATGKTYAIYSEAANTAFTNINYNDYFASGAQGVLGFIVSARADITAWRTGTGQDVNSKSVDPVFVSATDLHLQTSSTLLAMGTPIAGITVDLDGETRDNPPDIGADEIVNIVAPGVLQFSSASYSGSEGTTATITVTRSMGTTGSVTVDYATSNDTATGGGVCGGAVDYTSASGTLTFADTETVKTFTVSLCSDAASEATETVTLTLSNATGGASLGGTNPATLMINDVPPPLSGDVMVGSGQTFTTLTAAVAALNTRGVSGATTLILKDSTYPSETFPITINSVPGASASNTITIRPAPGVPATISGSSASAIIVLNGADFVTIDGTAAGAFARELEGVAVGTLTITNTNASVTSAVVWLQTATGSDGATNNAVKNVNLVGSTVTATPGTLIGVGSGSSTIGITSAGTGNNNNTFQNNNIKKTSYGVYSGGASVANKNTGTVVIGNVMNSASPNNITTGGILANFENGIQITQNDISVLKHDGTTGTANTAFGIALGIVPNATLSVFTGSDVVNAQVSRNKINGITQLNSSGYSAFGIVVNSVTSGTTLVSNNMVSGVISPVTGPSDFSAGILAGGGTGSTTQIYHNSVAVTGVRVSSATFPSYGLAINSGNPTVDVKDNVFYNTQTTAASGTAKSYAIGAASTTFTNMTSNFNDFFVSGTNTFLGQTGVLGTGGTDRATLAAWRTATSGDANSLSANPNFVNASNNLHVQAPTPVESSGTDIPTVTVDFDGQTRSALTPVDIGADAGNFKATPVFSNLTSSQAITYGTPAVTLGGKVSVGGSFYPAAGETITVTINGNAQNTTINDATGDFSINYNSLTLPVNPSPYTITYSYGGNGPLNPATDTSTTLTVNQKALTISGLTGDNKVYDGNASATFSGTPMLVGVINMDDVTLGGTPSASFNDKNVGMGKPITVSGYTLGGSGAGNYTLTQPILSGDITAKGINVTANPQEKAKGATDPTLTFSSDPLFSGDSFSGALARTPGETPGTYAITQGTLTAGTNYAISFTGANFIITGPIAGNDGATRTTNSASIKIPLNTLLTNDIRIASGGSTQTSNLSVTGVTSGAGNTVSLAGAFVFYTPTDPSMSAPLNFTYTLTDGVTGTTDTGTVTVTTLAPAPFALQIVDKQGPTFNGTDTSLTVEFISIPNQLLTVEYSTDMTGWTSYAGNPVNTGPSGSFAITLTAPGDQTTLWSTMFFRATK